jgi:hypothetical protein
VADLSHLCVVGRTWCSFAFVNGAFSRKVVGRQASGACGPTLILDALRMAMGTATLRQCRAFTLPRRGSQGAGRRPRSLQK